MENNNAMDPNFVPEEYKTPYDIIELPSQGLLYPNKKSKVKVEFLTAMDENILSSPNISENESIVDILVKRKVKDLGFDIDELLTGDKLALIIFLRVSGFGEKYTQMVWDKDLNKAVEGEIDLTKLNHKKLSVTPDENGLFDFTLPKSQQKIKFKLLTTKDEKIVEQKNNSLQERTNSKENFTPILRLEQSIQSIDGETDKMKLSNTIKRMNIMDIRKLNKYIGDIEPGIDFKTVARTPGGASIDCFLRITSSFFWPEL
jgi:hypothetical protein